VAEIEQERRERPDVGASAPSDPAALTGLAWLVRAAAFRAILATGEPWDPDEAAIIGADARSMRSAIDQLLAAGRVRTNQQGHVTASGGLSVDPTPHRTETSRGARWTQCAYDALGILGALGEAGTIETSSPSAGRAQLSTTAAITTASAGKRGRSGTCGPRDLEAKPHRAGHEQDQACRHEPGQPEERSHSGPTGERREWRPQHPGTVRTAGVVASHAVAASQTSVAEA